MKTTVENSVQASLIRFNGLSSLNNLHTLSNSSYVMFSNLLRPACCKSWEFCELIFCNRAKWQGKQLDVSPNSVFVFRPNHLASYSNVYACFGEVTGLIAGLRWQGETWLHKFIVSWSRWVGWICGEVAMMHWSAALPPWCFIKVLVGVTALGGWSGGQNWWLNSPDTTSYRRPM
jgi:hypothetical protein